ncbi:hypothetical protein A0H76_1419 [Hepatospora eriocheir]|uniref:Uncharacterized protein n=1 Tax=Hepatospora eriocheir TaxID=1081669 RepID=A0A1X0QH56_9MICR|nr:hypothetical protein A0H76_1419 [Hepatospora eriocheir]
MSKDNEEIKNECNIQDNEKSTPEKRRNDTENCIKDQIDFLNSFKDLPKKKFKREKVFIKTLSNENLIVNLWVEEESSV